MRTFYFGIVNAVSSISTYYTAENAPRKSRDDCLSSFDGVQSTQVPCPLVALQEDSIPDDDEEECVYAEASGTNSTDYVGQGRTALDLTDEKSHIPISLTTSINEGYVSTLQRVSLIVIEFKC